MDGSRAGTFTMDVVRGVPRLGGGRVMVPEVRHRPRARDHWLRLFGQGGWADTAPGSGWLALQAHTVSRPEVLARATSDEVLGVGRAWKALEGWTFARKLTVVRELIRRHPKDERYDPEQARGLPGEWEPSLHQEIAAALGISVVAAGKLARLAWTLDTRLRGIGQALEDNKLDPARVKLIADETSVLQDDALYPRAEAIILAGLPGCKTWGALLRLVQRAVITVDPQGAQRRREQAEREHARVRFWREACGTCAMQGTGLPTDEALAANANIEARARAYKAAGVARPMDILRVMAYLDLLNGVTVAQRAAWARADDAAREAEEAERQARGSTRDAAAAGSAGRDPDAGGSSDGGSPGNSAGGGLGGPGDDGPGGPDGGSPDDGAHCGAGSDGIGPVGSALDGRSGDSIIGAPGRPDDGGPDGGPGTDPDDDGPGGPDGAASDGGPDNDGSDGGAPDDGGPDGGGPGGPDGGGPDGGGPDGGAPDDGGPDGGGPGGTDGGGPDGGAPDDGSLEDAGPGGPGNDDPVGAGDGTPGGPADNAPGGPGGAVPDDLRGEDGPGEPVGKASGSHDDVPDGGSPPGGGGGYPHDWPADDGGLADEDPAGPSCQQCGGAGSGTGLPIRASLTIPAGALQWLADWSASNAAKPARGPTGAGAGGGGPGRRYRGGPGPCPACGSRGSASLPAREHLVLPLLTLTGLADRPGEAHGLGALDPALVRDLAAAGARHPGSQFCVTVADEDGHAIGHGCCRLMRGKKGHAIAVDPDRASITPSGRTGPDGGHGSWIITLPGAPLPLIADIYPVPTFDCDHQFQAKGYQPGARLRHLVQARDGECSFPACSRPARESDYEHATPYGKGGRTCACNAHACSRSCHRAKQSEGWRVTKPRPGWTQWTTGAGRTYLTGPWQYPALWGWPSEVFTCRGRRGRRGRGGGRSRMAGGRAC